ncbi:MAG: hypothetical protein ACP5PX_04765 [Candidatus Hadarchaeum sp.]|uniref:hypothetical protein n=1 Tax=Candidatus Hadarchaeum sp. TaxID=2883567 RepID=UPI003D10EDD2
MSEKSKPDILGLLSFGFFLILVGAIFSTNPNLPGEIHDFLQDLTLQEIYPGVKFFAPASSHLGLYAAAFNFSLALAIFNVLILALRFAFREPWGRRASTASSIFFWSGAVFSLSWLSNGAIDWFTFLGCILTFFGGSIVLGGAIRLATLNRVIPAKAQRI